MPSEPRSGRESARQPSASVLPLVGPTAFRRAARAVVGRVPHAMFVVNVERWHDVVSHCGHGARDALHGMVTAQLVEDGGPWQSACRLADGRFALLKTGCRLTEARTVAHRLHAVLERASFGWRDLSFRLGATIAVFEIEGRAEGLDDLLERTAHACDVASGLGSDGVVVLKGRVGEQEALEREREWHDHLNEVLG